MSAPLVFMDTETTGLSLDDDIWEFAAIRREPDGTEFQTHMFIEHSRAKCQRLPTSFRSDHDSRYRDHQAVPRRKACELIAGLFNGRPHVVGAVPNFDTERLRVMFVEEWANWPNHAPWHYHLIDVENLAVGYLAHKYATDDNVSGLRELAAPPWNSDDLAAALGVTIDEAERHTAMGDARWAMRIYDAVMGAKPVPA